MYISLKQRHFHTAEQILAQRFSDFDSIWILISLIPYRIRRSKLFDSLFFDVHTMIVNVHIVTSHRKSKLLINGSIAE